MSSADLFATSATLREAARALNRVDAAQLDALLRERAVPALRGGGRAAEALALAPAELARLGDALALSRVELRRALELVRYVLEQAAHLRCSAAALGAFLASPRCGLQPTHAQSLATAWQLVAARGGGEAGEGEFAEPPFGSQLSGVTWSLNVNLAASGALQTRHCSATLLLDVAGDEDAGPLAIEFSHQELSRFFLDIERLQAQLDAFF
jgi:hypothetical protein